MKAKDILTSIIESLGISPADFSRSLFLPRRSCRVQKVLSGETAHISRDFAEIIKKYYPQFNLNYILNGLGDMYADNSIRQPHTTTIPANVYLPKYILECIYEAYHLNANRLALLCGLNRSVFINIANPNNCPKAISERNANLIIANVDHSLSLSWLMYGTGPMYNDGRPDYIPHLYADNPQPEHESNQESKSIESLSNEELMAKIVEMQQQLANLTNLIHQKGVDYHDRAAEPQPEEDK